MSDRTIEVQAPTEEDVKGAATALLRLQRTYLISTEDLAKGKVHTVVIVISLKYVLKYVLFHIYEKGLCSVFC